MKRSSENMLVRPNADGTYSATWTPGSVGWYSVLVTIDGYAMEEVSTICCYFLFSVVVFRLWMKETYLSDLYSYFLSSVAFFLILCCFSHPPLRKSNIDFIRCHLEFSVQDEGFFIIVFEFPVCCML